MADKSSSNFELIEALAHESGRSTAEVIEIFEALLAVETPVVRRWQELLALLTEAGHRGDIYRAVHNASSTDIGYVSSLAASLGLFEVVGKRPDGTHFYAVTPQSAHWYVQSGEDFISYDDDRLMISKGLDHAHDDAESRADPTEVPGDSELQIEAETVSLARELRIKMLRQLGRGDEADELARAPKPLRVQEPISTAKDAGLNEQEQRALALYASGRSIREVAVDMDLTVEAVDSYINQARLKYRKLGIDLGTKSLLRRHGIREGWLAPE